MPDSNQNMNDCNFTRFEKNKYFYGKLMTVRDFETEQQYFDGKRYLINRLLHGTGIVSGFKDLRFIKNKDEIFKISFEDGGMALDGCGHEIVVPPGTMEKEIVSEDGIPVSSNSIPNRFYLYLRYKTFYGSYLAVASNSSNCEEKCCPGKIIEDFEVVLSDKAPDLASIPCRKDILLESVNDEEVVKEPVNNEETVKKWLSILETNNWSLPRYGDKISKVFLAYFKHQNDETFSIDNVTTEKYRPDIFRNEELYKIFKCHFLDFNNPHGVTASQVKALESINGIRRDWKGNIELVKSGSIVINPSENENSITIGETHSADKENPHDVTAEQVKALESIDGVGRDSRGDIALIQTGSIEIKSDKDRNNITIGETHSNKTDNPHKVTAEQVKALESIDRVGRDPKGNINLIRDGSIVITSDSGKNSITIGETHSQRTDNPHHVTAAVIGALVSVNEIRNPGGNIDLIEGTNIKITSQFGSIKFDCTLGLEIQPSETVIKSIGPENLVGTSNLYAREDHVHMLEDNSVDSNKLSAGLQEQLGILSAYVRERALKCSASNFKKIAEDFKNDSAYDISLSFKKAIGKRLYEKEDDFIKFIDSMQSPIKAFADEIRDLAEEGGLIDFENSLEALKETIGEGNPLKVAAQQDEVCFYALELRLTVNDPLYKALNCTGLSFRKVAELFKSETASKISFNFEKAIDSGVYQDRDKFVKFMQENLELLRTLSEELKIKATEGSLSNYSFSVEQLADSIDSDEALEIADRQQEVCSYAQNLAVSNNPINNPMYRALKCAVGIYREVSRKLQSDIADTLSIDFERAVNSRLYDSEKEFIEFMESEIDLLKALPEEIEGLAIEEELTNYIAVVNELADAIQSGNALEVAAKQEELCFYAEKLDPSTLMYRALKCTTVNFAEAADLFENKTAKAISEKFGIALNKKIHEDDDKFIKFMDENLELFETFAKEIKDLATKETLKKYISSVEKLAASIRSEDTLKIAVQQEEVCSTAWGLDIHLVP